MPTVLVQRDMVSSSVSPCLSSPARLCVAAHSIKARSDYCPLLQKAHLESIAYSLDLTPRPSPASSPTRQLEIRDIVPGSCLRSINLEPTCQALYPSIPSVKGSGHNIPVAWATRAYPFSGLLGQPPARETRQRTGSGVASIT